MVCEILVGKLFPTRKKQMLNAVSFFCKKKLEPISSSLKILDKFPNHHNYMYVHDTQSSPSRSP